MTEKGFPDKPLSISSLGRRAKEGEWDFKCGIQEAKPLPPPFPFTSLRVTVGDKGREGKGPRNFALWKSGVRGGSLLANGKPVPCVSLFPPPRAIFISGLGIRGGRGRPKAGLSLLRLLLLAAIWA